MTLRQWAANGWLRSHETSPEEIANLFGIVDRDLADAEYLETCRKKRNIVEYDYVGGATDGEVDELISFVKELRSDVLDWLRENHPQLRSEIDNTF